MDQLGSVQITLSTGRHMSLEQVHKQQFSVWEVMHTAYQQVLQKNMMVLAWTTGGTLNTARERMSGCGTQTAGLAVGGNDT
jgi:trans-aconitate methyltransferase